MSHNKLDQCVKCIHQTHDYPLTNKQRFSLALPLYLFHSKSKNKAKKKQNAWHKWESRWIIISLSKCANDTYNHQQSDKLNLPCSWWLAALLLQAQIKECQRIAFHFVAFVWSDCKCERKVAYVWMKQQCSRAHKKQIQTDYVYRWRLWTTLTMSVRSNQMVL